MLDAKGLPENFDFGFPMVVQSLDRFSIGLKSCYTSLDCCYNKQKIPLIFKSRLGTFLNHSKTGLISNGHGQH